MRRVRDLNRKPAGPGGRPTKKVQPVILALLRAIETGLPYNLCCRLVGISYDSFITWKREDREFNQTVEAAAAKAAARLLDKIERQARNNSARARFGIFSSQPHLLDCSFRPACFACCCPPLKTSTFTDSFALLRRESIQTM